MNLTGSRYLLLTVCVVMTVFDVVAAAVVQHGDAAAWMWAIAAGQAAVAVWVAHGIVRDRSGGDEGSRQAVDGDD